MHVPKIVEIKRIEKRISNSLKLLFLIGD